MDEARIILWEQMFPESHLRIDNLIPTLDKLVRKVMGYQYNYVHDPNRVYENGVD
jgi:hypothetical protein